MQILLGLGMSLRTARSGERAASDSSVFLPGTVNQAGPMLLQVHQQVMETIHRVTGEARIVARTSPSQRRPHVTGVRHRKGLSGQIVFEQEQRAIKRDPQPWKGN
jgi:hypothetical protein